MPLSADIPLSSELNPNRSLKNPVSDTLSACYEEFQPPLRNKSVGNGFDVHVYFTLDQLEFAEKLHDRARREFPELETFRLWKQPIGPHTLPMFEVDIRTPLQLGAFLQWIVFARGDLSVLIHPHTDDQLRDHVKDGIWIGEKVPLKEEMLRG
ncbi:hypothetical protein HDU76_003875 [Blyttiomyces sp. JEL0837]|nr:hypothetical protein HDU76_003875 [Blyttiomyces sp. JEL0837]